MNKRHQIVHLISFVALVVSLFGPVLALPVVADDPVPEPEVTLVTEDGVPETSENGGEDPPVDDLDEGDEAPSRIPVVPVMPLLTDLACVEGSIYAQAASEVPTEGITYDIGAPDAAGTYAVAATLTDTSVYTWADGLSGWTISDSVAFASGEVALCPVTEPNVEAPDEAGESSVSDVDEDSEIEPPPAEEDEATDSSEALPEGEEPAEAETEGNENEAESPETVTGDEGAGSAAPGNLDSETLDDKPELDDALKEPEDVAEPSIGRGPARDTGTMSGLSMGATSVSELMLSMSSNPSGGVTNGSTITYTITVTNHTGSDLFYAVENVLPAGLAFESFTVPYPAHGDDCNHAGGTIICGPAGDMALYNGWSDVWTITVSVTIDDTNREALCQSGITNAVSIQGGASTSAFASLADAECTSPLSIVMVTNTPYVAPGFEESSFTVTITNTGDGAATGVNLSIPIPTSLFSVRWEVPYYGQSGTCAMVHEIGLFVSCQGLTVPGREGSVPGSLSVTFYLRAGALFMSDVCGRTVSLAATLTHTDFANTASSSVTIVCDVRLHISVNTTLEPVAGSPGSYKVTHTYTIRNLGKGTFTVTDPDGMDFLLASFPVSLFVPIQLDTTATPAEIECVQQLPYRCAFAPGVVIQPDSTFVFGISAVFVPEAIPAGCAPVLSERGTELWPVQSWHWLNSVSLPTLESECPEGLAISINGPDTALDVGSDFNLTVTVTKSDAGSVGMSFIVHLPAGTVAGHPAEMPVGCAVDTSFSSASGYIQCFMTVSQGSKEILIPARVSTDTVDRLCADQMHGDLVTVSSYARGVHHPEVAGRWKVGNAADSTDISIRCTASLDFELTADNTLPNPGDLVTYTLKITNNGIAAPDSYSFEVTVFGYAAHHPGVMNPPEATCSLFLMPFFICSSGSSPLPGESRTFTFKVTVTASFDCTYHMVIVNNAGSYGWNDPDIHQFPMETNCQSLSMSTSTSTDPIHQDDQFTYNATVANNGLNSEGPYAFTHTLPAGIELVDSNPITAPDGASCTPSHAGGRVVVLCESGASPASEGGTHQYSFNVRANFEINNQVCGPVTGQLEGTAGVWSDSEPVQTAADIGCSPDLTLAIGYESDGASVELGDTFTYVLTVSNIGWEDEDLYEFMSHLPAGVVLAHSNHTLPTDAVCPDSETGSEYVSCRAENLAAGESHTYRYTVRVSTTPTVTMCNGLSTWLFGVADNGAWQASLTGPNGGITHTINLPCPELGIALSDNVDESIGLFEPFAYTIAVSNTGATEKGDFALVNTLPYGVVPIGVQDARCDFDESSILVAVTCGDSSVPLTTGTSFVLNVHAVEINGVPTCGPVHNHVSVDVGIWVPSYQEAYAQTVIECISDLTFTKASLQDVVIPGETIGWEIILYNNGNTTATSIALSDDLPELPGDAEWGYWVNGESMDTSPFGQPFTNLARGETITIRIESPAIPPDLTLPETEWCVSWENTAKLTAEFTDGISIVDQERSASVRVNCTGLGIDQQVSAPLITSGSQVAYTITVTNHGNTAVKPLIINLDVSELSSVFSNWQATSDGASACSIDQDGNPSCTHPHLESGKSVVMTVTGDSPPVPEWQQCTPVSSQATAHYTYSASSLITFDELLDLLTPNTPAHSATVATQLDCQPGVGISKLSEIDLGENNRVDAGDKITYTIRVTNSGNMNLYDIVVTDDMPGITWDGDLNIDMLVPAEAATFTGTYLVSQDDIDSGSIANTASVRATLVPTGQDDSDEEASLVAMFGFAQATEVDPPTVVSDSVSNNALNETVLLQEPGVNLVKTSAADTGDDNDLNLGEHIAYTFVILNTGNVTLTGVELVDDLDGLEFGSASTIDDLAPGESTELTASYTVSQADVEAGEVENCAEVTAVAPNASSITSIDCVTNSIAPKPPPVPTVTPAPTGTPIAPATSKPTDLTTTPDAEADPTVAVIKLPDTGSGGIDTGTPLLWIAAMFGVASILVGVAGSRKLNQ